MWFHKALYIFIDTLIQVFSVFYFFIFILFYFFCNFRNSLWVPFILLLVVPLKCSTKAQKLIELQEVLLRFCDMKFAIQR